MRDQANTTELLIN